MVFTDDSIISAPYWRSREKGKIVIHQTNKQPSAVHQAVKGDRWGNESGDAP